MNSRDVINHTLAYDNPSRLGHTYPVSDIVFCGCSAPTLATDWHEVVAGRWERIDEWGNRWARLDAYSKGEVVVGALETWDDLEKIVWPDFKNPVYYETAKNIRNEHGDKYVLGALPGFAFNIARKMRRLELYLTDLLMSPDEVNTLHDQIDSLLEDMIRNFAAIGADGIMITEDWGTQGQLMIDPKLWYEAYYPRFVSLCSLAHSLNLTVWMHSCGKIESIMPGLITAGVNVFQFDQPELHGLDVLHAYQQESRVTFWCPVDIQKVLPTCEKNIIENKVKEMLDKLYRGGGFIAGCYPDPAALGIDPAFQEFANETFERLGNTVGNTVS